MIRPRTSSADRTCRAGRAPQPHWLPTGYGAVIGRVDSGSEVRQYGPGFDGMLMGGNAVIRRSVLARVGLYRTDLGQDRHPPAVL